MDLEIAKDNLVSTIAGRAIAPCPGHDSGSATTMVLTVRALIGPALQWTTCLVVACGRPNIPGRQNSPVSNSLVIAHLTHHLLGLPRSN